MHGKGWFYFLSFYDIVIIVKTVKTCHGLTSSTVLLLNAC